MLSTSNLEIADKVITILSRNHRKHFRRLYPNLFNNPTCSSISKTLVQTDDDIDLHGMKRAMLASLQEDSQILNTDFLALLDLQVKDKFISTSTFFQDVVTLQCNDVVPNQRASFKTSCHRQQTSCKWECVG